jgi:hypothetical protein
MLIHVGRRLLMPMLALQAISLPFTTFAWLTPPIDFSIAGSMALTAACFLTLAAFLHEGQKSARARGPAGALAPLIIGMSFGLSICYTHSVVLGLFGRRGVFVSTPKHGGAKPRVTGPRYAAPFDWWCFIEIAAGVAEAFFLFKAIGRHYYAQGVFFGFLSLSFLAVGFSSLLGSRRPAVAAAATRSLAINN